MNTGKKYAAAYPAFSVETTGILIEELAPGVYRASLPNGKITVAHAKRELLQSTPLALGARVQLSLTPADFEHARIVGLLA